MVYLEGIVFLHLYIVKKDIRARTTDRQPRRRTQIFCENPPRGRHLLRRESGIVVSFVAGFGAWSKMKRRAVRALYELLRLVDGGEEPVRMEGIVWRQQFAPSSPKNPLLP